MGHAPHIAMRLRIATHPTVVLFRDKEVIRAFSGQPGMKAPSHSMPCSFPHKTAASGYCLPSTTSTPSPPTPARGFICRRVGEGCRGAPAFAFNRPAPGAFIVVPVRAWRFARQNTRFKEAGSGASRVRARAFVCGFIGRCCRILGVRLPRPRVAPALAAGKAPLFGRQRAGFGVLTAKNRTCRRPFRRIDGRRTRFLRQHRRHPRRAVS